MPQAAMTKRQDDIPPGMMLAPPRFDSEGHPICQLCGVKLVPGVLKGGNWPRDTIRRGLHICSIHPNPSRILRKRKQAQRVHPQTGRQWLPLMEFQRVMQEKEARKEAARMEAERELVNDCRESAVEP